MAQVTKLLTTYINSLIAQIHKSWLTTIESLTCGSLGWAESYPHGLPVTSAWNDFHSIFVFCTIWLPICLEYRISPNHYGVFIASHLSWNLWWDISLNSISNWLHYFWTNMIQPWKNTLGYFDRETKREFAKGKSPENHCIRLQAKWNLLVSAKHSNSRNNPEA